MKNVSKKEIFESLPIPKAIAIMAIPTIISQLINLIYNIVDTIFIGRTGNPFMVSALTISFTVYMFTVTFGNLFGIGGGSLIARLIGRKEDKYAKNVSSFSFYGALATSLIYSLIVLIFLDPILTWLGASSNTLIYAKQYVTYVVILGGVPIVLCMVLAHILRNNGYSTHASFGLSMGGILNIALDPLFMFVLLPKGSEVIGAGMATLIANCISLIFLLIVVIKKSKVSSLSLVPRLIKDVRKIDYLELFSVGLPSAALTLMFDIGNIVLNQLASSHGDLELAAIGIVMKSERLPNAINMGLCQGMLPIVAYNYASKNEQRRKKTINLVRLYGLSFAACGVLLYCLFATSICELFLATDTGNVEDSLVVVNYAALYLAIRCFASPFQFINFHSSYSMQAMGDGKGTFIHAGIRILLIYIPMMYILDSLFGINGLVLSIVVSEALSDIPAILLLNGFQRKIDLV